MCIFIYVCQIFNIDSLDGLDMMLCLTIHVVVQLLVQEKNPGLKYEYIIKKTKDTGNEVIEPIYRWRHGAWTDCSTTCGLGWCRT